MASNDPDDTVHSSDDSYTADINNKSKPSSKRSRESSPEDEITTKVPRFRGISGYVSNDVNAQSLHDCIEMFFSDTLSSSVNLKDLIDGGMDLHSPEKVLGYTLLHMAAHCNDPKKLKILLDNDFNANARAKNNVTPLHLASMVGNVDMVRMLLEHHVEVDCRTDDSQSLTPLHLASMERDQTDLYDNVAMKSPMMNVFWRQHLHDDHDSVALIELLLQSGADINARDARRNTALHFAALRSSDKHLIGTLLKSGAYVDVRNNQDKLPLHNVLASFNVEGLTRLLEFGADVNDLASQFGNVREYESSQANAFCNAVLEHTNKLRAADLTVSEVYKSDFHKSFWLSHRVECSREVERLKTHFLVDRVSLYDFLHMSVGRRRAYTRLVLCLETMNFPKYCGIISGSCRQAVARRSLLELSKVVWTQRTQIVLPDVCLERIFSFLDNTDLTFFVDGADYFLKVQQS